MSHQKKTKTGFDGIETKGLCTPILYLGPLFFSILSLIFLINLNVNSTCGRHDISIDVIIVRRWPIRCLRTKRSWIDVRWLRGTFRCGTPAISLNHNLLAITRWTKALIWSEEKSSNNRQHRHYIRWELYIYIVYCLNQCRTLESWALSTTRYVAFRESTLFKRWIQTQT